MGQYKKQAKGPKADIVGTWPMHRRARAMYGRSRPESLWSVTDKEIVKTIDSDNHKRW